VSRDYLAELRAGPPPAPPHAATPSPTESAKAGTQGTAITAKSPFDSFGSSQGGRFSEIAGLPAVVAEPVRCADCQHFEPGPNPLRGRCGAGAAGVAPPPWFLRGAKVAVGFGDPEVWATAARACESWLPHGLIEAVHAMADRWGYSDSEREIAIEEATQKPQQWLGLIEADLQGRRWPGGEGWS
jgi:hypothetical protein